MIKHIFGPVPSRRLGISLGVDIIPFKTCTLDCIYCECGGTTNLTAARSSFVDAGTIIEELKPFLAQHQTLEYITFSGSGEPTLNKDLKDIIAAIKKITLVPVAVLTNGTLLYLPEVRESLLQADLILPSLDAVSPPVFARINQPHQDLEIGAVIEGMVKFREQYKGDIRLEVFIVSGINDGSAELKKLYEAIKKIKPDRVQLNSLDRPPAYDHVEPLDTGRLEKIAAGWQDLPARVEVIKRAGKRREIASFSRNLENNILNTIDRRPLTIEDLEELTGKKRIELYKYIDILEREKKVIAKIVKDKIFYAPTS
ncbi:MAG: radical SAM protein [Candidatus Aminicenantes bacterium]|nr:radical SAM protein [Candidatus Aminicenantes bacterium]